MNDAWKKHREKVQKIMNELDDFGTACNEKYEPAPTKMMETENKEDDKVECYQWANFGNGVFSNTGKTKNLLASEVYSVFRSEGKLFLKKEKLNYDELIEFKDSLADKVINEVESFWNNKEKFKEYNFLHRRGYIFYGKAGCGKSGIIYMIIDKIIKRGGIVLLCSSPYNISEMVKIIRKIEPNRHIVVVFEDIDAIIRQYGEDDLLSFLDGEGQADDVLNLATTNYPEKLDKRIISRPRRFDRIILVEPPNDKIRKDFFMKKLKIEESEIDKWVEVTSGFSFASMSDLVISVKCLNISFNEAVEKLKKLNNTTKIVSSDDYNKNDDIIGFVKK